MDLNLPRGHPMRIERQHLVVKAVEPPLPFLDHRGFKCARPIARHRQVDRAVLGLDRLGTTAIPSIVSFRR